MDINLFLFVLFDSFVCCGAYLAMRMWFKEREEWYWKPLYMCPACMASVWGGSFYILFFGFQSKLVPVVIALVFLNSLFMKLYWKIYE